MASTDMLHKRRQLSSSSSADDTKISSILQDLTQKPVTDSMPPLKFGIDTPLTIASIYGAEKDVYLLLDIQAIGRFDGMATEDVNKEMMRRVMANGATICATCKGIYPAFENMLPISAGSSSGRRLLQAQDGLFEGSVTILLVYDKNTGDAVYLSYADILASIYGANGYSQNISGLAGNPTALQRLASDLANNYVFVNNVTTKAGDSVPINIVVRMQDSLILNPPPVTTTPPSNNGGGQGPKHIDVSVYGIEDRSWVWDDVHSVYKSCGPEAYDGTTLKSLDLCKDISMSSAYRKLSEPVLATLLFLAASIVLFWN